MTLLDKVLNGLRDLPTGSLRSHGALALVVASCTGCGISQSSAPNLNASTSGSSFGHLGAKLVGRSASRVSDAGAGSSAVSNGSGVQGLYFGDLEIVAYNYRPGQPLQNRWSGGNAAPDWSHWVLVSGGSTSTRDLVLQPGQQLDYASLQPVNPPIDPEFASQVGQFSVDFLEVWVDSPGVIYSNTFYGQNNYSGTTGYSMDSGLANDTNALYKYSTFTSFPFYFSPPQFAFFPDGASSTNGVIYGGALSKMSVFFARNDWFPTPVLVQANDPMVCTICDGQPVTWSSAPLNSQQLAILNSLISQGTRSYGNIIIVPNNRVVVGLNTKTVGTPVSSDGTSNGSDASTVTVSPSQDALIGFDIANAINLNTSSFSQADFWHGSVINFATDPNGVPMGLSVNFVDHSGTTDVGN